MWFLCLVLSPILCKSVRNSDEDETFDDENQKDCGLTKYECCPDGVTPAKVFISFNIKN